MSRNRVLYAVAIAASLVLAGCSKEGGEYSLHCGSGSSLSVHMMGAGFDQMDLVEDGEAIRFQRADGTVAILLFPDDAVHCQAFKGSDEVPLEFVTSTDQ